jgi:hypothetical protein
MNQAVLAEAVQSTWGKSGTYAVARTLCALTLVASPVGATQRLPTDEKPIVLARHGTSIAPSPSIDGADAQTSQSGLAISDYGDSIEQWESVRSTTAQEILIGEIREWALFGADWDGEGAQAPNSASCRESVEFVRLLKSDGEMPDPMLLASGHAGLLWRQLGLYADLEFLGDGKIAYYIERNGDRHKGVVSFDKKTMPSVFAAILAS